MGSIVRMDPKLLKMSGRVLAFPSNSTPSSKSFFQSDRPEPPLMSGQLVWTISGQCLDNLSTAFLGRLLHSIYRMSAIELTNLF